MRNKFEPQFFKSSTASGNIYLISGPSGVGKTSIINILLSNNANLKKLVSYTTRPMRPGEIEGHTYYYIAKDEFNEKLARGDFLQHSEFDSNFYGYDKKNYYLL